MAITSINLKAMMDHAMLYIRGDMLYSVCIHDNPLRAPIMRIHNNPLRAPIMLYTRGYMLYMTIIPHPEIQPVQKISFTDAGKNTLILVSQ